MEHNAIICIYDDRYEVVGPFASVDALSAYGSWWQEENGDRPTWQSVRLDDGKLEASPFWVRPDPDGAWTKQVPEEFTETMGGARCTPAARDVALRWALALKLAWHVDNTSVDYLNFTREEAALYDRDMELLRAESTDAAAVGLAAWRELGYCA